MGCSWYSYAGTLYQISTGYLLIPQYAQKWAGTDKLEIKRGGEYCDFEMANTPHENKNRNFLDGNVLSGIFEMLYNGEEPEVTFDECYYEEDNFPYHDDRLEKLRHEGISNQSSWQHTPYSMKVVPLSVKNLTYEACPTYSPSSQEVYYPQGHPDHNPDNYSHYIKTLLFYFPNFRK